MTPDRRDVIEPGSSLRDALQEINRDARWMVAQWQRVGDEPLHQIALAVVAKSETALRLLDER